VSFCISCYFSSNSALAKLKKKWKSPIYQFFLEDVSVSYNNGRKYHFFRCAHAHCKGRKPGVRRYQDTGDKNSTANLKAHALGCFGQDIVDKAIHGVQEEGIDRSIFSFFAKNGHRPLKVSHRAHTNVERRCVYFFTSTRGVLHWTGLILFGG
jgi:hypothetical protein